MLRSTTPAGFVSAAAALGQLSLGPRLPGLSCAAHFVAGREDAAAPPATVSAVAETVPGAVFSEVAGVAHLSAMEAPDRIAGILSRDIAG